MRNILKQPMFYAVAILALAAGLALAGIHVGPEAAGLGMLPLAIGEIDIPGLADLLKKQGAAFEEFKKANDDRLKAIESKGYAPEDTVAKVEKINGELNELSQQMTDLAKKHRAPAGQDGKDAPSAEQLEHKQRMADYLRLGETEGLKAIERKAMSSLDDPKGGYLVTAEMDAMIDRVMPTVSAMYRLARNVTISTQKWAKRVKTSGMAMRRPGQGSTGGESTPPNYALIEIEAHLAEVEPWVENETLEDADLDLAMDLADEAAVAFAEGLGSEFIGGNGVAKAKGITAYTTVANASYAWGKIGYIASGGASGFASSNPGDQIIALQHALKQQYQAGAVFLTSFATLGTIRQMKDGSGNFYLWQPDPTAGFGGRLLGAPVEIDDNMPAVAANAYSLAYGNFQRGYAIVNRRGTVLIRDNVTQKGVTKFNFTRRTGGGVYNFEAIKLLKMATS